MPRLSEQIEIDAARVDVFRFCYDLTSWPEWNQQVVAVELLGSPPVRRGALLRIDAKQGRGAVFSWEAEVINYQMPSGSTIRAIDTAGTSPFGSGSELQWEFESIGDGRTRVTWTWNYTNRGFFAGIKNALGGKSTMNRAIKQSLKNLKTLIESGRRAKIN